MKGAKASNRFANLAIFFALLSLLLSACTAPTAAPTPDPRPALETMVAATMRAAVDATRSAAVPTQAPSPSPSSTPVNPEAFEAGLEKALAGRDFAALTPLLSDPFDLTLWRSDGSQVSAAEAAARLRGDLMSSKAELGFTDTLPAGVEVVEPPGMQSARHLFSTGWGQDGFGEVILTTGQGPDGRMVWRSLLFAPQGFNPPEPAAVKGVINVASANLRSGPSPLHALVAPYAMGTELTVSYAAPGFRWGKVTASDGKEGWLLLSLMDLDAAPETLPLYPGTPPDSIPVIGWVEGGSGQPIDKAVVSLWQKESDTTRPQAFTGQNGMFYLYLPADSTGSWTVGVVSVDCTSSVMDEQCEKQKDFVPLNQTINLPHEGPVVFVYNNIMGETPASAAEGCVPAEPGKIPLSNSQDGYCLLYPEGFTIRQPATNVLEIVGPGLDQEAEPLAAKVIIQKKPLPEGSSLETVAAALWSGGQPGFSQNPITLGEQPALYADHLITGGATSQVRKAVVIYEDSYYIMTFTPYDSREPYSKAMPDQEKLWEAVTQSFRFNQ